MKKFLISIFIVNSLALFSVVSATFQGPPPGSVPPSSGDGLLGSTASRAIVFTTTTVTSTVPNIIFTPNQYVGISTVSTFVPAYLLDVNGSVHANGSVYATGFSGNGTNLTGITASQIGPGIFNGNFGFASKLGVGYSDISSLPYTFDVNGTGRFTSNLFIPTSPTDPSHAANKGYVDAQVASSSGNALWLRSGGTNTYLANSSDNVGIGTQSPQTKLDVQGTASVSSTVIGTTPVLSVVNTNVGTNVDSYALKVTGGEATYSAGPAAPIISYGVYAQGGTARNNQAKSYGLYVLPGSSVGGSTTYAAYFGGTVGVNTTAPLYTLDVGGDIRATGTIFTNAVGGLTGGLVFDINSDSVGSDTYMFRTRGIEIVRFADDGKVGVGVPTGTGIASRLHVMGTTVTDTADISLDATTATGGRRWRLISKGGAGGVGTDNGKLFLRDESTGSNRLVVDTSGNVGIGTTAPTAGYKLDVAGSGRFTVQLTLPNAPAIPTDAANKAYVDSVASGGAFWSRSGTSTYLTNSGDKVGIGTSTPSTALSVYGTSSYGQIQAIATATGTEASVGFFAKGDQDIDKWVIGKDLYQPNIQKGSFAFFGNNSPKLVINTAGNVGIGDSGEALAPAARLVVKGTTNYGQIQAVAVASDEEASIGFFSSNAADATKWTIGRNVGNTSGSLGFNIGGIGGTKMMIGTNGNVAIGTTPDVTAKLSVAGQIKITGGAPGANKVLTSDANGLASWVSPPQSVAPTWTTSGNNIFNANQGNVGIGTGSTIPVNKLEVWGNLHVNGNSIFLRQDPTDQYDVVKWNASNDMVEVGGYNGVNIGSVASANTVTPILSATGGNVGIGTSTPNARLDVIGSVARIARFSGSTSDTTTYYNNSRIEVKQLNATANNMTGIGFQTANGNDAAAINTIITNHTSGAATGILTFLTSNSSASSSERVRIDNNGNVGIGTSTPSARLDVAGTGKFTGLTVNGTGNASIRLKAGGGGAPREYQLISQNDGSFNIFDATGSASRLSIGEGGYLTVNQGATFNGAIRVISAQQDSLRLQKTSGVLGSVDLFPAVGDATPRTGTELCRTVSAQAVCISQWDSGGVARACTDPLMNARALCSDIGD